MPHPRVWEADEMRTLAARTETEMAAGTTPAARAIAEPMTTWSSALTSDTAASNATAAALLRCYHKLKLGFPTHSSAAVATVADAAALQGGLSFHALGRATIWCFSGQCSCCRCSCHLRGGSILWLQQLPLQVHVRYSHAR